MKKTVTQERYTKEQIAEILAVHAKWLRGEKDDARADLRSADLYGANLRGANLSSADLRSADLRGADLRSADLYGADLRGADLRSADLRGADLYGANLSSTDLRSANLSSTDLRSANLSSANLRGANLSRADLYGANLSSTDLYGTDLRSANLSRANLSGAQGLDAKAIARRQIVPETGSFEAFKRLANGVICRLRIPANACRVGGMIGRKCRAEFAEVLAGEGPSSHNRDFVYSVGKIVRPDSWDPDPLVECSHGIHFFLTYTEAEECQ